MKKIVLTIAITTLTALSVHANLGDTREDAQQRWGKPVSVNNVSGFGKAYNYIKKGWQMMQYYNSNGYAYYCCYYRLDGRPMNAEQSESIDRANLKTIPESWNFQNWKSTDISRSVQSFYDSNTGYQIITAWSLLNRRWVSSRTMVDNTAREENGQDNGQEDSGPMSNDIVPL